MYWVIPAAAAAVMLGMFVIGAVRALIAGAELRKKVEAIKAHPTLQTPEQLQAASARITSAVQNATKQTTRMRTAIGEIRAGLSELRLREAVIAVRLAGLALRALWALR